MQLDSVHPAQLAHNGQQLKRYAKLRILLIYALVDISITQQPKNVKLVHAHKGIISIQLKVSARDALMVISITRQ